MNPHSEKDELAAEEYSGLEFIRYCNGHQPSRSGATAETKRDAFLAGAAYARAEETKNYAGVLGIREDEYVSQVGTWKIIQRLEEQLAEHEAKTQKLVETLGLSEKAIEALVLTQVDVGMGLLGKHIVVPETLRRIREALADYELKEIE